ncbi:cysteine dioxygenase [Amycolatopsis sp. H20-H5]|uniref:cysteine dioxygenase n=1 Tax=Amycolatopsis sp. H20-H5 TaxID=3046309 RepID=UPI002DBFB998|nr:cysteine dioxygenase family protein [Amycolatopsis sp. H20-H5]MEC3976095.1 cysteine dioxygenase family protein [Amycolatopsis sp. H20-H5]
MTTSNIPNAPALPAKLLPSPAEFDGDQVRPDALRRIAAAVAARPESWASLVSFDLAERYFTRLHHDERFEVWLICWERGQDTLLHDHGGSVGGFAVARGTLVEDHAEPAARRLRTRSHRAGDSVAFGARYLHNLVNVATEPAITVHAYSRPLHTMNFYCWLPSGAHHLREIACASPEPDTADLERVAARTRALSR